MVDASHNAAAALVRSAGFLVEGRATETATAVRVPTAAATAVRVYVWRCRGRDAHRPAAPVAAAVTEFMAPAQGAAWEGAAMIPRLGRRGLGARRQRVGRRGAILAAGGGAPCQCLGGGCAMRSCRAKVVSAETPSGTLLAEDAPSCTT